MPASPGRLTRSALALDGNNHKDAMSASRRAGNNRLHHGATTSMCTCIAPVKIPFFSPLIIFARFTFKNLVISVKFKVYLYYTNNNREKNRLSSSYVAL